MAASHMFADDRSGAELVERCDYCGHEIDASEPRTEVGSAVFHRTPNCYLKKLQAIGAH